jgi:hypothetical protein
MKTPSELVIVAAGSGLCGWLLARERYVAAIIVAPFVLGAFADFQRRLQQDLNAARKWREQRGNAWKALEQQYRDEVFAHMPPTVAEYNERIRAAEKRAAEETMARLGPIV